MEGASCISVCGWRSCGSQMVSSLNRKMERTICALGNSVRCYIMGYMPPTVVARDTATGLGLQGGQVFSNSFFGFLSGTLIYCRRRLHPGRR